MGAHAIVQGSLNIDMMMTGRRLPARGESILGASFATFPGGKGANQAVQLARLGMETFMIGRVGADVYGDQLIASLQAAGVRTDAILRDKEHGTGKGWVFIDEAGDNYIIVVPEANMEWQVEDLAPMAELCAGADLFLCQLETPVPIVDRALRQAKAAGLLTALNPAPAADLPADLFQHVDLLVLNQTEAAFYAGRPAQDARQAAETAAELRERGCGAVVLTLGERGAVACDADSAYACDAYAVPAVDVTAAGDSFSAGLAYAMVKGQDLSSALRFACACGALTVTRAGAQPSLPTLAEVRAFMQEKGRAYGGQDHI